MLLRWPPLVGDVATTMSVVTMETKAGMAVAHQRSVERPCAAVEEQAAWDEDEDGHCTRVMEVTGVPAHSHLDEPVEGCPEDLRSVSY